MIENQELHLLNNKKLSRLMDIEFNIPSVDIWRCPVCCYNVSDAVYAILKHNISCPKCGQTHVIDFLPLMVRTFSECVFGELRNF